jgi:hypothetical protein
MKDYIKRLDFCAIDDFDNEDDFMCHDDFRNFLEMNGVLEKFVKNFYNDNIDIDWIIVHRYGHITLDEFLESVDSLKYISNSFPWDSKFWFILHVSWVDYIKNKK